MTDSTKSPSNLTINVGPLNGLGSFCFHVAKDLKKFNDLYRSGFVPNIEWDLRQVEARKMSMASLTAFLAIADRMRQVTGHSQGARVLYMPRVFRFWDDIQFLELIDELDLFQFIPHNIVNGYWSITEGTNPNSKILSFPKPENIPAWENHSTWTKWKDRTRQLLTKEFLSRCGQVFEIEKSESISEKQLHTQISNTAAELVLNAHYWGNAGSFVGLQRSTVGISVAVCDVGRGFLASLLGQTEREKIPSPKSHLEAIFLGSFLNNKEYGLRLAIQEVLDRGGWVTIASYDAEIRWSKPF